MQKSSFPLRPFYLEGVVLFEDANTYQGRQYDLS